MAVGIEGIVLDPLLSQSPWPTEVGQGVSFPSPASIRRYLGLSFSWRLPHWCLDQAFFCRDAHLCVIAAGLDAVLCSARVPSCAPLLASAVQGFPTGGGALNVREFPARPSPFCWCASPQLVQVAVVDSSGLSISRPLHLIHQMPPRTGVQGLPASQFHMHPLLHCDGVGWSSGLARLAGAKLVVLVSTRGANVTSTYGPAWGPSSS